MRSASRPLDQTPKRAAWCPSSIASRSQPARPGRASGRCSRARHLTYGPRLKVVHAFRPAAERKRIRGRLEGKGDGLSCVARRRHLGPAIQGRAIWDQSRAGSKIASDIGTKGGGGAEAGAFASGSRPTLRQTRWQSTPRRCLAPESASKISIRHQATRVLPKPDASRARVEPRGPRLSAGSTPRPGREPSDAPTASAGLEGGRGDTAIKVVVRQTSRF